MSGSAPEQTPEHHRWYRRRAGHPDTERSARRRAIRERARFYGLQVEPENPHGAAVPSRKPGDDNIVRWGFDIHPQVTFISAGFLLVFLASTLAFSDAAERWFATLLDFVSGTFGWFYVLVTTIFVVVVLLLAVSRYGTIRLGGQHAEPEFSRFAWYAMLTSAGMGIGMMFWSVAEPIYHYQDPSPYFGVDGDTPEAAGAAMVTTFFHWGLHPWAVYALVALALAFFTFNRGLPLTMRSVFYPLLGERIHGVWGNVIDIISVVATLFGLATSLGFGVQQVSTGLNYLIGTPDVVWVQVALITGITGLATISVVAGLDGGVKRLSELNLYLAGLFFFFIVLVGPTLYIINTFVESTGGYLQALPGLSLWTEAQAGTQWQGGWTIFYWGWWISWAPFVGMFIARVSKGRTVREFIVGVVLIPSVVTFLWMSAFGGSALHTQAEGVRDIASAVNENVSTATFDMLQAFPLSTITSVVGVALVMSFFVTSSDSGSLVVDHLTSGGKLESPVAQRVFWAIMEGALAAVLLMGGGLQSLQSVTVASGIAFACVLLVSVYSLKQALAHELLFMEAELPTPPTAQLAAQIGDRLRAEAEEEKRAELEDMAAASEAIAAEYEERASSTADEEEEQQP